MLVGFPKDDDAIEISRQQRDAFDDLRHFSTAFHAARCDMLAHDTSAIDAPAAQHFIRLSFLPADAVAVISKLCLLS